MAFFGFNDNDENKSGGLPAFGEGLGFQYNRENGGINPSSFVITVDTTKAGSAADTFVLPLHNGTTSIDVSWGDGNVDNILTYNDPLLSHTYSASGIYQIEVFGQFSGINFANTGDKLKLSSIDQWGTNIWQNGVNAFSGCANMIGNWSDAPDLSGVSSMAVFFSNCTSFDYNIGNWNVSTIDNFYEMFRGCTIFNNGGSPDINNWTTTSLTSTIRTFYECSAFNQPVGNWDTSGVLSMTNMFYLASSFNQNLGAWDVQNVTTMSQMFFGATVFNNGGSSDINNWVTTSLTNMSFIFASSSINQPLSNWDTSNVTALNIAFFNTPFDQDISSWNISSLTNAASMFQGGGLSTANYDALLVGWEGQAHNNGVNFHAGSSTYTLLSAADTARTNLITDLWSITDGGGI